MKNKKNIIKSIVLIVVFALIISALGILSSLKSGLNSVNEVLEQKSQYIIQDIEEYLETNVDAAPEDIYEFIEKEYGNNDYINGDDTEILLLSNETGTLVCASDQKALESILNAFDFHYLFLNNSFYYISDLESDYKVVLQIPIARISISNAFLLSINTYVSIVAAAVILIFLFISIKAKLKEKKIVKTIKVIGLVWIIISAFLCLLLNCAVSLYNDSAELISISEKISDEVDDILTMQDAQVQEEYTLICSQDSDVKEYVDGKNCTDMREKLLYARTYELMNPEDFQNNVISDLTLKDNIWDTSVPITERLGSVTNDQYIINTLVSNAVQMAMFIMLYIILTKLVQYSEENTNAVRETKATNRVKKVVFFKNIADSLMAVVAMAMLSAIAKDNFTGIQSGTVKTITMTLAGLASLLAVIFIEWRLIKAGSMKKFFILSFVVCMVGCCCCLITKYAVLFIIGYVLISFAETLVVELWVVYPLRLEENLSNGFKQLKFITNAGRVGTLFGLVLGGILGSFIPLRVTYLIAMLFLVIGLILSFFLPKEEYKGFKFERGYLKKSIFNKAIIPLIILILIPYGFMKYYFQAVVPLNIASLGLTTTLVAFIRFFQQFAAYYLKNSKKVNGLWRKRSAWFNVVVGMLTAAVVLTAIYLIQNIYIMLLLTLVVVFILTGMSSQIRNLIYEVTDSDDKQFFGQTFVYMIGSQLSKLVAPVVTSVGIYLLAVFMGAGVGGYSLVKKFSNKNKSKA